MTAIEKNLLSNSNLKLGRLSSFSLPLCSCDKIQSKLCKKYCYARYMYRLFPMYKRKMLYNLKYSKTDNFLSRINYELKESTVYVRIHVSGDFYSQEYLDKWITIAKTNQTHVFYCYTKSINLDYSKRPSNLIVYLSDDQRVLQKHYKRFDGIATISFDKKPIEGFTLCQNQATGVNCSHCGLCWKKGNKIVFNKH